MKKKVFTLTLITTFIISILLVFKSESPKKTNERKYKPDTIFFINNPPYKYKPDTIFFINNPPYAYKVRVEHWEYYTKTEKGLEKNILLYISGTLKYTVIEWI